MTEGQELEVSSNPQLEALKGLIPEERLTELQQKVEPKNENEGNPNEQEKKNEGQGNEENVNQEAEALKAEAKELGLPETATKEEIEAKKAEGSQEKKEETQAPEKKNPLGLGKKKESKSDIVIEKPEQIVEVINKKYGQNLKDFKDLPKFFESYDKTRVVAQKAETLEKENEQLKELWESKLPAEFLDAAQAYFRGEDHIKVFTSAKKPFDLKADPEKQDIKALVNHYFPEKFSDDDFTDAEPSQALQIAKEAALDKFKVEKQLHERNSAEVAQRTKQALEAQKAAADSSLTALKQSFPDMEKENFMQIETLIKGGQQAVASFFYNKDGTVKPDAAKRLALAIYGEEQIAEFMEISAIQAESRVNEDLLTRGADGPKPKQSGAAPTEQISEETKQKLDELKRIIASNKTTF